VQLQERYDDKTLWCFSPTLQLNVMFSDGVAGRTDVLVQQCAVCNWTAVGCLFSDYSLSRISASVVWSNIRHFNIKNKVGAI
jgi:hypothetical protein